MKKEKSFNIKYILFLFLLLFFIVLACYIFFSLKVISNSKSSDYNLKTEQSYHVLIIGSNENELFLKEVYEGAINYPALYKTVVELYVPQSRAEDLSTQSLFEYASFVNADGIIAYIKDSEEIIEPIRRIDNTVIPIVTIGQYAVNTNQICYVGQSYWELGHLFGKEISSFTKDGTVILIQAPKNISNTNYSNLTNSILATLKNSGNFSYKLLNEIDEIELQKVEASEILLVGLTEEDTLKLAQLYTETRSSKNISIIGYGNNETCQTYLSRGTIKELISQNPKKVGESAIREMIEYRNKGYANNYVVTELEINRSKK